MITKVEVEKLAHLARIELGEDEKKELQKELGSILEFVSKLKEVEVREITAGSHILEGTNVFREDAVSSPRRISLRGSPRFSGAELIESAPQKEKGYIKVKSIFANNGN